ncbi:MAG: hypothetical protein QG622_2966 [Actinomycetota bacterium]|nr:hypothetical protein [Actinomycetota bacterium]
MTGVASSAGRRATALPPWLLVYAALTVAFVLPGQVTGLQDGVAQIEAARAEAALSGVRGVEAYWLLLVAQAVPPVSLVIGLAYVVFPGLRRRMVEHRHPLTPSSGAGPAEMQNFVDRHATRVEVCLTTRPAGLARVYPKGFRRARIAVSPGFLHLWDDDRPAAEATLLHEIAHRRQGEHLLAGVGGPFQILVRIWAVAFVVFSVLPVAILALMSGWDRRLLAVAATPQLAQDSVLLVKLLVFPVAALWLAELVADEWAARLRGTDAVLSALSKPHVTRFRTRMFGLLDHPPLALRRRMLRPDRVTWFLFSWPAVPVALHFLISAAALVPTYWLLWNTFQGLPAWIVQGLVGTLRSSLPLTVTSGVLLAGWSLAGLRRRPLTLAALLSALLAAGAFLPVPTAEAPDHHPSFVGPSSLPDTLGSGRLPLVLKVTRVVSFDDTLATPEQTAEARTRLMAARWTFDENGRFELGGSGLPSDLYPVHGQWTASPHRVDFSSADLTGGSSPAGGLPPVSVSGSIDAAKQPPEMELMWSVTADPMTPQIYHLTTEVAPA